MNIRIFVPLLTIAFAGTAAEPLTVVRPRCERLREAIGLANAAPRFTWGLAGGESAGKVRAEIRVGECADALLRDERIVWRDTGDDLFGRTYAGPSLTPEKPYFWQVRLVDEKGGGVSDWSIPEKFIVALQGEVGWAGAKWICENRDYRPLFGDGSLKLSFKVLKGAFDAQVRCTADGKGGARFSFGDGLSDGRRHEAELVCRGARVEAKLDGKTVATRDGVDFAGSFGVSAHDGADIRIRRIAWVGTDGREELYDDFSGHRQAAFFRTERDNDGLVLGRKDKSHFHPGLPSKYCPRLRKAFRTAKKRILWATASVSGRGFYELWLNGRKADPRRVITSTPSEACGRPFETYDVTELVRSDAANTVGVWLAPGYSDDFSRYGSCWLKSKRARAKLTVAYADGKRETVVSDGSWESTDRSPITYASIYHGEIYDAALEDPAWCDSAAARKSTAVWSPVLVCADEQNTTMCASETPPVRMLEPLRPVRITEPQRGVFVVDFGQNRGGFVEVRAKGPRGTAIRLRTSEILGENGMIDPWTNRRAISADTFVLAGTGKVETYVPRFTYHGFHYVEITGWPGVPTADDLTAWAVHADLERTASFDCSDKDLMKVHNAATWSMLSNLVGFPTDCCMRDERTACSMDSQAYEDTSCQFFDMERYYAKWCDESGVGGSNPDWSGDGQTLPMRLWKYYGNRRELERRYEGLKQAVANVYARYPDGYCKDGFGDWCAPNAGAWKDYFNDVELVNTAIFATMIENVVTAAKALGKDADVAAYAEKYARERQVFESRFRNAGTPTYGDRSQTTFVLPLAFGLVPEADRASVLAELVKTIREKDRGRFDTGIYGTRYIGDVLLDAGEADLFRDLFTQKEYPGFGFMFKNGGTTLWEQWTIKGGMNSHNHAMMSGAVSCFFTHLAGIRPAKPGYAAVLVRPTFPTRLDSLAAARQTPHGEVKVAWRRASGKVSLEVTVPPYVPATLELPGRAPMPLAAGCNRLSL